MIICDAFGHLYTTNDIRKLHHFATVTMQMEEAWNHCSRWFPHWDLTTAKMREKAYRLGAYKPSGHEENADLIYDADSYAYSLRQWLLPALYDGEGLYGQKIKRVNYAKMFAAMDGLRAVAGDGAKGVE